jgi:HD-like signal output (HDOD) protein
MQSLWSLVRRLFRGRRNVRDPRLATPAAPPPRGALSLDDVDLHDGAGADLLRERRPLSDEEHERLEVLKARVVERFLTDKIEITAFPSRAAQILRILDEPDFDIGQLVLVTQRDPVISASVLRAANSAAFAGISPIETVRDAVMRLGAQTVAGIATVVTARGLFDQGARGAGSRFSEAYGRLWLQSVTTAFTAGAFASASRQGNLERSFLGGMLHDIGKTVALRSLAGMLTEIDAREALSAPLLAAILEAVHVDLGRAISSAWNLPSFVVDACAHHHLATTDRTINVICVASGLHELATNPHFRAGLDLEVRGAAATLGLDGYMLRALSSQRRDYAAKATAL